MNAADPQALVQWREALLWVAKAEADIAGARTLLSGDQRELVAAAQDVRRTHDIDAPATLARMHWPQLLPSPFPLAVIGQWYVTTRYPGFDEPTPTAAEVAEALAAVAGFVSEVARLSPPDLAASGGKEGEPRR